MYFRLQAQQRGHLTVILMNAQAMETMKHQEQITNSQMLSAHAGFVNSSFWDFIEIFHSQGSFVLPACHTSRIVLRFLCLFGAQH